MKKKFLFTLAAMLALATQLSADPVSKQDALKDAEAFMKARGMKVNIELQKADGPRRARAAASEQNESPYYYVFNNENDGGFVIISGDDRTQRVLGYSDKGHFDLENMPDAAKVWFSQYENEMDLMEKYNYQGSKPARAAAAASGTNVSTPTHSAIQPLTTVQWFQLDPLNQSCPYYATNKRSAVGCTTLAMAQLIYHYRDRMASKLPIDIPGYKSNSITVPTIKAGTEFHWDRMFDKLDGSQTSTQIKAVANFLYYSAVSLKSSFGQNTFAYLSEVSTAVYKYFGFAFPKFERRGTYTYAQWKAKIIAELEQERPVYYCSSNNEGTPHAVIIDGYDGGELFHVNWGWGGLNDGYFSLSVLEPFGREGEESIISSTAYAYNNSAYFDMQPLNGYKNVDNETTLTCAINSASGKTAKVTYTNKNTLKNSYTCGLGVKNSNNTLFVLKQWDKGEMALAGGATTGSISYTLSYSDFKALSLSAGTYRVFPIYKMKGSDLWLECYQETTFNYISAEVTSNDVTLSKGTFKPSLSVTEFSYPGSCVKSVSQPVVVSVKNTGDEFVGTLYLFANNSSSKGTRREFSQLYIPGGKTTKVHMNFTPKAEGTFNVWITTDAAGNNVIGQSKVTIGSGSYSRNLEMTKTHVEHIKSGTTILGTTFEGTVTLKNNSSKRCAERVVLYLFTDRDGWKGTNEQESFFLELGAGESKTLPFKFENLGVKWRYGIAVMYPDNSFIKTNPYKVGYVLKYAPMCYTQDGVMTSYNPTDTFTVPSDAVAVDLTGTTGTVKTVVPNNNSNTLYYIGSNETVISGLSGKNVIKGTNADNIKLVNEKAFYSPKAFVAKKISFSLVPSVGAPKNGVGGWRTLTLPFTPTQIKTGSQTINYFKSDNDSIGRMWIKEFSAIAGKSAVQVDYAQQLKANHPYIYAVPSNEWGSDLNLVGKTITFSATNATVAAKPYSMTGSDAYNFKGTYSKQTLSNIYTINADGTSFVKGKATVKPFNCYFIATSLDTNIIEIQK